MRLAPGKPQPLPEDVPYELVETVCHDRDFRTWRPSGEFRLLRRVLDRDPDSGAELVEHRFWDGAPGDFMSREEARLWCECAGIDFDREVLET